MEIRLSFGSVAHGRQCRVLAISLREPIKAPFQHLLDFSAGRYSPHSLWEVADRTCSMFRLAGGETWLDGLALLDPDTGNLNYGAVIFINR